MGVGERCVRRDHGARPLPLLLSTMLVICRGDELLHMLVGAVVVRAVGDGRPQAVRAGPGAHEHVRGGSGDSDE